jgi:predicted tellurium resistance membrane protein TerC
LWARVARPGPQVPALFWWAVQRDHGGAVDNIFVFLIIFTCFAVAPEFKKRVQMISIENGRCIAPPLLLVMALVGLTDVTFAVDLIRWAAKFASSKLH